MVYTTYSRRFATATARTASLGSHSRGIETKNIRKYWLSEKKTRRIWWPCIADQRSSKNNEKHEKTAKLLLFYSVFARWEAETTANTMVFEGQVAKNTVIYCVFLTNVKKHWYLRCFHSHRNIKQRNLRGFWKFWS